MCEIVYKDLLTNLLGRNHYILSTSMILGMLKEKGYEFESDREVKDLSAIWISGEAYLNKVPKIKPVQTVSELITQFVYMGKFDSNPRDIKPGDFMFYIEHDLKTDTKTDCVGFVFRVEEINFRTTVWAVVVDKNGYVHVVVRDGRDRMITGYGRPTYSNKTSEYFDDIAHPLDSLNLNSPVERDSAINSTVKYCAVVTNRYQNKIVYSINFQLGPGHWYRPIPWFPKLYPGMYVQVIEEVSSMKSRYEDDTWILVVVDKSFYGYIEKKYIVPATFQNPFSSGKVVLGDSVYFTGGIAHTDSLDIDPFGGDESSPSYNENECDVVVIGMDLYSSNPYNICQEGYTIDSSKFVQGWVSPRTIRNLW